MDPTPCTGILLVGGASERFGSPKALALFRGQTLAERSWGILQETCDEVLAVGKTVDGLELPFPVLDDGAETRAPVHGVIAGLRAAANDVCLVLPVDCPLMTADALRSLAEACADAAVPETAPLPGAYAKSALPVLEQRLASDDLGLHEALIELDVHHVELDEELLTNVNTERDLDRLRALAT